MRNKIVYEDREFTPADIESAELYKATNLIPRQLEADTITAVVKTDDTSIVNFKRNALFYYYHKNRIEFIAHLQSVDRIGEKSYRLYATSPIGRLIEMTHAGGIYTGQPAEEVIFSIFGDMPVIVKTVYKNMALYGWLPYADGKSRTARDNLLEVLFAIGATVRTDLNGVPRIQPIWDGISGLVPRDKLYRGAEIQYNTSVTQVSITEHQYITGNEEEKLFEGTAQSGDIIVFREPMHSLSATGFSVLESNANFAKLSAGSGVLTGKKYVHTTRKIMRNLKNSADFENVKAVEDATLVSLVNSSAVANRLVEYYKCTQSIVGDIVTTTQTSGDVLASYHPYDKKTVSACAESLAITASGILKAREKTLVGYIPPQPEDVEYFDHREVITQSGEWTGPEGVTEGVAVLIGGAWGGWSGMPGGETEKVAAVNYTKTTPIGKRTWHYKGFFASQGGAGGEPGAGGSGGRILVANFTVPKSGKIRVEIGVGGAGGVYSADGSQPGTEGTPTTFGGLSSASGTPSSAGYVDTVTGEIFAQTGVSGVAGGTGSGGPDRAPSDFTENPEEVYVAGSTVTGPDGRKWTPDRLPVSGTSDWKQSGVQSKDGESEIVAGACFGMSGGAAVGANGANGAAGSTSATLFNGLPSASCWCGVGGKGADAVAPAKPTGNHGQGGGGGHGGGGAGGSGFAYTMQTGSYDKIFGYGELKSAGPGKGSDGAPGGDGVLILYYRTPRQLGAGQVVTRDLRFMFDRLGRILVV